MDTVAIAGMAMNMQAARLQQTVSMTMLKKEMDTASESAQSLINMMVSSNQAMEHSVNPHLGSQIDILA